MVVIPAPQSAVTLFHRDGRVWVYRNKQQALEELGRGFIARNVGVDFRVFSHTAFDGTTSHRVYQEWDYVLRGDQGRPLVLDDFFPSPPRNVYRGDFHWRYPSWNGEGAVPSTGRRHRHRGSSMRRPRTQAERRMNQTGAREAGVPAPRGRRNEHHLPSSWDDISRSDWHERSWKRHRRTQYKPCRGA